MILNQKELDLICDHCGDHCLNGNERLDNLNFCCHGCEAVYTILLKNDLGNYYQYASNPGISQRKKVEQNFEYLNNSDIVKKLISFSENGISKITLELPQIHCSSCLWLLENISSLNKGIIRSLVNFHNKTVSISYLESKTTLREIVELLSKIGYEPRINYNQLDSNKSLNNYDHKLIYKLGLAGFSFSNIMLLSFPEYLGFDKASYLFHIGYINILLATPVLLYCGSDYIRSAYRGLKIKDFNIDLPIALGMLALFGRSLFEIISHQGEGYLDSFSGFVFFLLIGRWFQNSTYKALDFDRNYKSYFPISATLFYNNKWVSKSLNLLKPNDILRIRNQELIPSDGIIMKGRARIDYSFVTGESNLISKQIGEEVYAGGRHQGKSIQIKINKTVNDSYLTQLWNEDTFKRYDSSNVSKLTSLISKYFTISIILLASLTMLYWFSVDTATAINAFTSVLIVACPCALALAIPFTYGNMLRLLSRNGFFLRNTNTIEYIQDVNHIIFDKTGTLTDNKNLEIEFHGKPLNLNERIFIKSSCSHSSHPLSKAIVNYFENEDTIDVDKYTDEIGLGFKATINGNIIKVGSSSYIFGTDKQIKEPGVFIEINNKFRCHFTLKHAFRKNISSIINGIKKEYKISLLSGDTVEDQTRIDNLFGPTSAVYFNQTPKDKLEKIKYFQKQGDKIMMIGDGLNDAGALKQANVGLVISDEENNFSPACDGIMAATKFKNLLDILTFIRNSKYIIYGAFALAFLYNIIGLYYAITGQLSPVIAAILMPLSSISVIIYGTSLSYLFSKKILHQNK